MVHYAFRRDKKAMGEMGVMRIISRIAPLNPGPFLRDRDNRGAEMRLGDEAAERAVRAAADKLTTEH